MVISASKVVDLHSVKDFSFFFQDGFSSQLTLPNKAYADNVIVDGTFAVRKAGVLSVTSGYLYLVSNILPKDWECLEKPIPPGDYSFLVSILHDDNYSHSGLREDDSTGFEIAYSMLLISDEPAVKWKPALFIGGQPSRNKLRGFRMDCSSLCSIMDSDFAKVLKAFSEPDPILYEALERSDSKAKDAFYWKAYYQGSEYISNCLSSSPIEYFLVDDNSTGTSCYNVPPNNFSRANQLILSHTTLLSRMCYCYWGYDKHDNIVSLVTDFRAFGGLTLAI